MTESPATGDWLGPPASVEWPTFSGYEILSELGRGGMGVVYKARQISTNHLVALKLLRDSALAGPKERARFRIEAEVVARLQHPNIVQILEVGEQAGRPFFAMELVEGGSLDKYLTDQPQPAATAAELVRTLALAVEHAHSQKVVHRDLKPANILLAACDLATDAKPQAAKITDFGLAKRLDSQSTALTGEGAVLGTAGYMAPEQAAGRVHEIGPAVDLYALGAILYELLTGRPPFQADSWNEMLRQVLQDEPDPPTRRRPDLPRDLETVCLKCLEKEPGRRYASAADLADDLGRFLAGQPIDAVPPGERERLARRASGDGYHIVGEVGRSPGGIVYHALSGPLKQAVVLKVFPAGTCTKDEWEARLRRSTELRAALAHPQVVPIHGAGWWDGVPYLVSEHVPHGSLAARLSGGPSPVGPALRLVEQLAEIVRYLHRQGVVHGNLKPSNVLFAADGIPRLADFRPPVGPIQGALPVGDDAPGGLGYLAPELVRDPSAEPRPHTDVYGLGIILYELVAGRPPFAAASARDVREDVVSRDPVPPSHFNPAVTPCLEALCLMCLRKNPWRRYSRVYDLILKLRSFQDTP